MITFSPEELKILQREAREALRLRKQAGLAVESYQERRLAFVEDLNRGEVFDRPGSRRWAARIKKELTRGPKGDAETRRQRHNARCGKSNNA